MTRLIKLIILSLSLLTLNGCITYAGDTPQAMAPLTNTIAGDPNLYNQEYSLVGTNYIYSGDASWVKIGSFSSTTPTNYKIEIAPSGPTDSSSTSVLVNSQKGVSQNNVLNLCYSYLSPSSTNLQNFSIPNMLGTNTSTNNNCAHGVNPYSNTNDCVGYINFIDQAGGQTSGSTESIYPGSKLYVVLETGSQDIGGGGTAAYQNNIIANNCPANNGKLLQPPGCSDERCSTCYEGLSYNNNCIAQVLSPWLLNINSTNGRGYDCSLNCPCNSAYEGGQISQDFVNGQCLFGNGMGYTFGYGNNIANLHSGANMFSNSLDPRTLIFQNSEVIDLPACIGGETSNCTLNFSLVGSGTNSYTNNDMVPNGVNDWEILSSPSNTSLYQWQKSLFMQEQYSNATTLYSLGVNSSGSSCSEQVNEPVYNTYIFAEKTGCYAIGGMPLNATDQQAGNGKLEYLFVSSGSTPDATSPGQGTIDGMDQPGYFMNKTGVSRSAQDLYVRIRDNNSRSDNYGYYQVNFYKMNPVKYGFLGEIISYVADPVQTQVFTVSSQFFGNVANSPTFLTVINAMLTLYIALFGVSFLMGNTKITQRDLVAKIFKIGVVLVFMNNETSTAFFYQYLLGMFWNGMTDLVSYVTGTDYIVSNGQHQLNYQAIFSFSDSVIAALFNSKFLTVLFMLLLWIPVGWIILILMIKGVLIYLKALIVATVSYLIALTAIGLFIGMAPIFIVLVLFDQTRQIFNNWIQVMTSFVFQPVIMFASIAVINQLMKNIIYDFTTLSVTLTKIFTISLPLGGSIRIDLIDIYWWIPVYSLMTLLVLIVTFNIFCEILKQTPEFASNLSRGLFKTGAGGSAGAVGGLASGMVDNNPAFQALGIDKNTQDKFAKEDKQSEGTKAARKDGSSQGQQDVAKKQGGSSESSKPRQSSTKGKA